MSLKKHKPVTPGSRGHVQINYKEKELSKEKPLKILTEHFGQKGGRNNRGQISTYHRGGGHKRLYRYVDFKRSIKDKVGYVVSNEYDPNRSSYISLVVFSDGSLRYLLTSEGLKKDDTIINTKSPNTPIKIGNSLILKNVPIGTLINNIELKPGSGGQIARSAGCSGKLIKKEGGKASIRLSSGQQIEVSLSCFCTIGIISNKEHKNKKIGKAGRSRWLNKRPIVRGVVMNPFDHPHGGGEGKTSGGRCSVTPWGLPTKGYKTIRKKRKYI